MVCSMISFHFYELDKKRNFDFFLQHLLELGFNHFLTLYLLFKQQKYKNFLVFKQH
ncbi:hypothetical protein [Sulfolobus spindle-shaped virus]|nr:hypothetical protein [Sulfolobus spindle-shaped virus]